MVKWKKRIIMYMTIIVMMTISMLGIGELISAENQEIVETQSGDISVVNESNPTPNKYFILEEIPGKPSERSIKFNNDATPAITEVVIPSTIDGYTVTAIGDGAFGWCALESITIPNTVTSIGESAFIHCGALTSVEIPNTITSIGDGAFVGCSALGSITIPNSVTSIGERAFSDTGLTSIEIPNSVTKIGNAVFYRCRYLESVEILNPVTNMGTSVFQECTALTLITLPSKATSIKDSTFRGCTSLAEITIPETVTNIGNYAFMSCSALTTITIPEKVTRIGDSAFRICESLTEIKIPDAVTDIGGFVFGYCRALKLITFPNNITSIKPSMFSGCTSLAQITIPKTVTSIEGFAFSQCTNLTTITIPSSVTSIGGSAFAYSRLTTITIPDKVESIGNRAFEECTNLTTITIPDTVKRIEYETFKNCTSLAEIIIPDTLTSIDMEAFKGCTSLKKLALPNTLTSLDSTAFDDSTVSKLIFICQDKNDMSILNAVVNNINPNITVYRMAADMEITTNIDRIDSYEFIGKSILFAHIFNVQDNGSIIYVGATGENESTDPDINAEDYIDTSITEFNLIGIEDKVSENKRIEDNTLYIGEDEISEKLKIEAVNGSARELVEIYIVRAESISIKEKPIKSIYEEGEEYKPDGLEITILYEGNHQEDIKYKDNENDFSFTYVELSFDTKEQEITYRGLLKVRQKLTVYGNKTLRDKNVEVKGMFTYESLLDVEKAEIDNDLKDKEIIAGYEINVVNGSYKETLTIIFDVENEYNGKILNIRHKWSQTEEFEKTVSEGKVTIEVDNLSPFIIYTEKEIIEEPETPIIPKPEPNLPDNITPEVPEEPVIKPSEPTPEKPVIESNDLNKPIKTRPNQNQPSTEDNNHLLLWGVLGIVGMSIAIMSVKKKNS